jgi:hypothetical protein
VFTNHYLKAKNYLPLDLEDAAHQRLRTLCAPPALESQLGALNTRAIDPRALTHE